MPFKRPTLKEISRRVMSDLAGRLPGTDPLMRRSLLGIIGKVVGGASHLMHGHIEYQGDMAVPISSKGIYTERHASLWISPRRGPVKAAGQVLVTGLPEAVVPQGSQLQNSDGAAFEVTADAELDSSGAALVSVEAVLGGSSGNTAALAPVSFISPVAGVNGNAQVSESGLVGGSDNETDEQLKDRMGQRMQKTPHGGAAHDYERWALEVPGVLRVWVQPVGSGSNMVKIAIEGATQTETQLAEQSLVDAVDEYLNQRHIKPLGAELFIYAPVKVPLNFQIMGLAPDTTATREAIVAELADLITREAEPEGTILLSHQREAISVSKGEQDHQLVSPSADSTAGIGEIFIMGTVTWL